MAILVADCPRCGAGRMTHEVKHHISVGIQHRWQHKAEVSAVCRDCKKCNIFIVRQRKNEAHVIKAFQTEGKLATLDGSITEFGSVVGHISVKDQARQEPPEHLPAEIHSAFNEGATCLAVGCWNAAGAMFRMCVDLTTRPMLPAKDRDGLDNMTRRDLKRRLKWLIKNKILPDDLRDLSACIREDGNDGAHQGTLVEADALDLLDFTQALLERIFTEPERLKQAKIRRGERRKPKKKSTKSATG